MKNIRYKKLKDSYWGGNGVGDVPASWEVLVDGSALLHINGRASYSGKWYTLTDVNGKLFKNIQFSYHFLKDAKKEINNYINKNSPGAPSGNQNRIGKTAPEVQKAVTVRGLPSEIKAWRKQYESEKPKHKSMNAWYVAQFSTACTEQ